MCTLHIRDEDTLPKTRMLTKRETWTNMRIHKWNDILYPHYVSFFSLSLYFASFRTFVSSFVCLLCCVLFVLFVSGVRVSQDVFTFSSQTYCFLSFAFVRNHFFNPNFICVDHEILSCFHRYDSAIFFFFCLQTIFFFAIFFLFKICCSIWTRSFSSFFIYSVVTIPDKTVGRCFRIIFHFCFHQRSLWICRHKFSWKIMTTGTMMNTMKTWTKKQTNFFSKYHLSLYCKFDNKMCLFAAMKKMFNANRILRIYLKFFFHSGKSLRQR